MTYENESLQIDSEKICEAFKKLYNVDNVVVLTRKGDELGTFSVDSDSVTRAMIKVAHEFHNNGKVPATFS